MAIELLVDGSIHIKNESYRKYMTNIDSKWFAQKPQITTQDYRVLKRYIGYMNKSLLARLRTFIINEWIPDQEEDFYLLDFIELWGAKITIIETDDLLENQNKFTITAILEDQ